jgi:hypothetical protein
MADSSTGADQSHLFDVSARQGDTCISREGNAFKQVLGTPFAEYRRNVVEGATVHHPGVLPGDPDQGYFVDGMTDELIAELRRNACLVLRSS